MEKFETRFPRIIARTVEKKKEIKNNLNEEYLKIRKKFAPYEIPEIERELFIDNIKDLESAVQKKVKKYRNRQEKSLLTERVRLLKMGGVGDCTRGDIRGGIHDPATSTIIIDRTNSDVVTHLHFIHERLHSEEPSAIKSTEKGWNWLWRGIDTFDGIFGMVSWGGIKEAVISELENQIYREKIKRHPFYQKEIEANEKITPWIKKLVTSEGWKEWIGDGGEKHEYEKKEIEEVYLSGFYAIPRIVALVENIERAAGTEESKLDELGSAVYSGLSNGELGISHPEERMQLTKLIDWIYKKSQEPEVQAKLKKFGFNFENPEQIFDQFAKATFTANPLLLRKIIEGSLGKNVFQAIKEKF